MEDSFRYILEILTPRRFAILKYLMKERHPEEVAREFSVSRQAADKHIAILYRAGLVEKHIKEGTRPMVYYQTTDAGAKFMNDIVEAIENHILEIKKQISDKIREFDEMLVNGDLSEREYWHLRRKLEVRFEWVKS